MNRDELLSSIDSIQDRTNPQNTDFDSAITNPMIDLRDNGNGSDETRLLLLSICDVQDVQKHGLNGIYYIQNVTANGIKKYNRMTIESNWWMYNICIDSISGLQQYRIFEQTSHR